MEELKLNSGLKKIAIKDEDGDLITVLSVNVADADTAEHFAQIINNLQEISKNCEKEATAWKKEQEQEETASGEVDVERVLQYSNATEKKALVTAWMPELGDYVTMDCYLPDIEYTIDYADETTVEYSSFRLAFVGYGGSVN